MRKKKEEDERKARELAEVLNHFCNNLFLLVVKLLKLCCIVKTYFGSITIVVRTEATLLYLNQMHSEFLPEFLFWLHISEESQTRY